MKQLRRNRIDAADDRFALAAGVIGGALAATSAAAPTGNVVIDTFMIVAVTVVVAWASASAPWWALVGASGLALVAAAAGPLWVAVLAIAAMAAAAWVAATRMNRPPVRTLIGVTVVNVVLRSEWEPFTFASALIGALVIGTLVVAGVSRRPRRVRRRTVAAGAGVAGIALVATVSLGIAAAQTRTPARDGYLAMLDGLELVQAGEVDAAADTLRSAADDLDRAAGSIGGVLGRPAQLVPVLAQNRSAGAELLGQAATAADSAAAALDVVDLEQLTISNGAIDVDALAELEQPLTDLADTIDQLRTELDAADSPWLVPPLTSRLDSASDRADQAARQSAAAAAAARVGPDLLGADGPRRYFIAFVNHAEARGLSGLMGNWSELTVDDGRIAVTANGRTADLQADVLRQLELDAPQEYIDRYAFFGARANRGVARKYWSNVTMTPDMPSVGNAIDQMYEAVTERPLDGVFVIDPVGVAALLDITGAVDVTVESDDGDVSTQRVDAGNAAAFLSLGQYEFAENEREDLLETITQATIANVLDGSLPPPQRMLPTLAPAALHGHIAGWAADVEEQELFELAGLDASLPVVTDSGVDAIAVVNHNGGGNKIDSFLTRTIDYRPVVDESTGATTAVLRIEFTNTAPDTGYTDYVIGNLVEAPTGTNRMIVDVYTRLGIDAARVDGEPVSVIVKPELGYWVASRSIDVAPGGSATLELDLSGNLGAGGYQLVYRPQPLPNVDRLTLTALDTDGATLVAYDGEPERRSLINRLGVSAWR